VAKSQPWGKLLFTQTQEQEDPMTDRYRVYTKVLQTLKRQLKMYRQGHVVTLAMMIAGIVMSHKARLSVMSEEVPTEAKEKSIEMRMRRWVKHEKIEVEVTYMPFARQILAALASAPLVLAMDGSTIGRGCMVLMVGVIYRKRALPLAWVVYKGKKGHASAAVHIEALEKVVPLIPEEAEVILLGDGEYDDTEMVEWVQTQTNWGFVLRTSSSIKVQHGQVWHKVGSFSKQKGSLVTVHQVAFTQKAGLSLNLVAWWGATYEEPIYLITNLPNGSLACWFYKRRFRIETFFSDQKSRGFHIHKSHLSDPIRISRLLIAACLAYIWMICFGLFVIAQGKTGLIDRTDRIDKSLFRLGLDWLKHVLKRGLPFDVHFLFQPAQLGGNVR
jgi:hypothetical protein